MHVSTIIMDTLRVDNAKYGFACVWSLLRVGLFENIEGLNPTANTNLNPPGATLVSLVCINSGKQYDADKTIDRITNQIPVRTHILDISPLNPNVFRMTRLAYSTYAAFFYQSTRNTGSAEDYDEDFPDGVSPLIIGEEVTELAWEAAEQTTCRRCDQRPPAPTLRYVRLESLWSPLLRPGVEAEVGLRFECSSCGAINLGSPLPVRGRTGRRWTTADVAVKIVGLSAPALEKPPQRAGSRRGRRGRSLEPAVETHDGSGVSGARRSALAGASSNATTPDSNNRCIHVYSVNAARRLVPLYMYGK